MQSNLIPPTSGLSDAPETTMSLDAARAVRWPFDTREPMGTLFDRGALTRSKLQWAAEKAKWPEVRRAAQQLIEELERAPAPRPALATPAATITPATRQSTMCPSATAQPAAPATVDPPRVVNASTYLGTQETLHGLLVLAYVGFGAVIAVTTLLPLIWLARGQRLGLATLVLVVNAIMSGFLIVLIRRRRRAARSYCIGRKGENQVVEQLRAALDHRWTIYRNLQLPERRDDLDLVLVGPGGVWVVQVKATKAPLRVQAGRWEVRRGGLWVAAAPDPGAQVTRQATALNDFFKRQGLNRFVERAVALSEPQPFDQFTASEIPVWLPFEIAARARALTTRYPPQADELARINELLGRRAVEQRAGEGIRQKRRT